LIGVPTNENWGARVAGGTPRGGAPGGGGGWGGGGGGGGGGGCDTCPTLVFTRKEKDGWSLMRKEGETGY